MQIDVDNSERSIENSFVDSDKQDKVIYSLWDVCEWRNIE